MPRILVVHGAGMNMRGKSQIDIFGPLTLAQYDEHIRRYARELECEVEPVRSHELGCASEQRGSRPVVLAVDRAPTGSGELRSCAIG